MLLYLRTLAPSVATIFDDSLEFQLVCYQPGIAHPPGYPLFTLLGKLFTFFPVGDVAYRVNLISAVFGALTVALVYATLRQLTDQRVAALLGASVLAVSPVFWSQSVIAEVYTLNSAFVAGVLCLLLAWANRRGGLSSTSEGETSIGARFLYFAALLYGLSLTHHRTMVLQAPAAILFVALVDRRVLTDRRLLLKLALLVIAPLALYLYLPLRGMTMSSLNGDYQNTLRGFLSYVTAGSYGVFLAENPLAQSRDLAFYATLLVGQFTWAGLLLAAVGLAWSFRRRRVGLLLSLFAVSSAIFALVYRVPDVEVFLIPLFLVCALWIGLAFSALWEGILVLLARVFGARMHNLSPLLSVLLLALGALLPLYLWHTNFAPNDLSDRWEVHEYGADVLNQPLEDDAVVVGILGEITLFNYFQQTQGLRPDLATIPADTEEERLIAVTGEMERGEPAYLTRPLSGVAELYQLSSVGPLIRLRERTVSESAQPSHSLSIAYGEAIQLLGYDLEIRETKVGPQVRLRLHWLGTEQIAQDYKISVRLLNDEGHLAGVTDSFPVRDAYRTNYWKPGKVVLDTHDLPVLAGVPPGDYTIQVTMYEPDLPEPIASATVGTIALPLTPGLQSAGPWDVEHRMLADMGGRIRLLGYSLIGRKFKQGDSVPLTFLWQGVAQLDHEYTLLLWLDDDGQWPESEAVTVLSSRYPPANWQEEEVVRDWQSFLIPGNAKDGRYNLRMQVRAAAQPLSRLLWRLPAGNVLDLGQIEIEGRERSFQLPEPEHPLAMQLGESITLLGYDLEPRNLRPGDVLHLTLYWQAQALMNTSYTVFVHLLDDGGQIQAQRDSVPVAGALPTTGWAEGEFIADGYEIAIPADAPMGLYSLAVGMYDAATGERLPTVDENGQPHRDRILLTDIELSSP